jgi:hypothetical protein
MALSRNFVRFVVSISKFGFKPPPIRSFSEHTENPVRRPRIHSRSEIETGEVEKQRRGEAERVDAIHHAAVAGDGRDPVLRAAATLVTTRKPMNRRIVPPWSLTPDP